MGGKTINHPTSPSMFEPTEDDILALNSADQDEPETPRKKAKRLEEKVLELTKEKEEDRQMILVLEEMINNLENPSEDRLVKSKHVKKKTFLQFFNFFLLRNHRVCYKVTKS